MKVLLRRTEVIDESLRLPRPKLTQDVLCVGSEEECRAVLDRVALLPQNQSSDQIEVTLYITRWQNQQTHNSKTFTKDNGQRNLDHLIGDASDSDHRSTGGEAGKRVSPKPKRRGKDSG